MAAQQHTTYCLVQHRDDLHDLELHVNAAHMTSDEQDQARAYFDRRTPAQAAAPRFQAFVVTGATPISWWSERPVSNMLVQPPFPAARSAFDSAHRSHGCSAKERWSAKGLAHWRRDGQDWHLVRLEFARAYDCRECTQRRSGTATLPLAQVVLARIDAMLWDDAYLHVPTSHLGPMAPSESDRIACIPALAALREWMLRGPTRPPALTLGHHQQVSFSLTSIGLVIGPTMTDGKRRLYA